MRNPLENRAARLGGQASPATTSVSIPAKSVGSSKATKTGGSVAWVIRYFVSVSTRFVAAINRSPDSTKIAPTANVGKISEAAASNASDANCKSRVP